MIIGISGAIGGGKGTVVEYLLSKQRFAHYSSSDLLIKILEERGETVDRDGMNRVANELRAVNPAGVPAENYQRYEEEDGEGDAIFESIHSVPEADFIKSVGGIVIGIKADPDIRYERILKRGSIKDGVTKEKFIEQQKREEEGSEDQNKSNIFAVIAEADFILENNGTVEELHKKIDEIIKVMDEQMG
jgi:dephospho-CoA kinase